MIIVTGGIKGGSGKTTIATHLAVMRAQNNSDTLLIDADDQETSFDFSVIKKFFRRRKYTSIYMRKAVRKSS